MCVLGFYVRAVLDAIVESNKVQEWVTVQMDQTNNEQPPLYWGEDEPTVIQKATHKSSSEISIKPARGSGKVKDKSSPVVPKRFEKNKM